MRLLLFVTDYFQPLFSVLEDILVSSKDYDLDMHDSDAEDGIIPETGDKKVITERSISIYIFTRDFFWFWNTSRLF